MIAKLWALVELLQAILRGLSALWAAWQKKKYEDAIEEIDDAAKDAGNPDLSDEERARATKRLEDQINRRA